jgi:hypothetical protein
MYDLLALPGEKPRVPTPPTPVRLDAFDDPLAQFALQVGELARVREIAALEASASQFVMASGRQVIDIEVSRVGTSPNWFADDARGDPTPTDQGGQAAGAASGAPAHPAR